MPHCPPSPLFHATFLPPKNPSFLYVCVHMYVFVRFGCHFIWNSIWERTKSISNRVNKWRQMLRPLLSPPLPSPLPLPPFPLLSFGIATKSGGKREKEEDCMGNCFKTKSRTLKETHKSFKNNKLCPII